MAFCKNCGQQIDDGAAFCPSCGAQQTEQPVQQTAPQQAQQPNQQVPPQQAQQYQQAPTQQTDPTTDKSLAWLSYFGIFLLIPLFARKASKFCQFHVRQGAILLVSSLAYTIVTQILLSVINAITPKQIKYFWGIPYEAPSVVYEICNVIFALASIFFIVIAIIGIINAVKGEEKKLPFIGEITLLDSVMDKIYASLNK